MPELTTVSISLASMEQAKQFVAIASRFPFEMDLRSGRYVVDAKSILGILSLGNRANILLDIYASECADFLEAIGRLPAGKPEGVRSAALLHHKENLTENKLLLLYGLYKIRQQMTMDQLTVMCADLDLMYYLTCASTCWSWPRMALSVYAPRTT